MTTPYCPKCGSVSIELDGKRGRCKEKDCGHRGSAKAFKRAAVTDTRRSRIPNTHWRDPAAMTMDGYEGE